MANLFKGFKQVLGTTYAKSTEQDKKGYIWFVRTEVGTKENLKDDVYDIYFGTKHYGHYQDGELPKLRTDLETIKTELGLDDNFILNLVRENDDFYETSTGVDKTAKDAFMKIADEIIADKQALADYKTSNDAKVAKHAVDVIYTKKGTLLPGEKEGGITADKPYLSLKLEDNSFTTPIDVNDFIVDGMIKSVELKGKYPNQTIEITWNTDSGNKQIVINVNDLYKPYEAGYGISIAQNLDKNAEVISVSEIHTNITKTKEPITVKGGPLADLLIKGGITKIEANTDMQTLLKDLFCKELWGTPKETVGSITATCSGAPKISMNRQVEVGTTVTATITGNKTTVLHSPRKMSGFTYGFAEDAQGTSYTPATERAAVRTNTKVNTYGSLSASGTITEEVAKDTDNNMIASISKTFVAAKGNNTVNAVEVANINDATYGTLPAYYVKSNLDAYSESHKSAALSATATYVSPKSEQTAEATCVGDYKYYEGYATSVPTTSAEIKALNNRSGFCGSKVSLGAGTCPAQKIHCIAVPFGMKLSSVLNGMNLESKGSYTESGQIDYILPNKETLKYHIYSQAVKAEFKYNSVVIA